MEPSRNFDLRLSDSLAAVKVEVVDSPAGQTHAPPITCADFDASGVVDVVDLVDIAGRWMQTDGVQDWNSRYDLFPTNRIDIIDLMEAMSQWGLGCQ